MSTLHELVVEEIQSLTPNAVAVRLGLPESLGKVFSYQAGQYLTLEASINNAPVRRAYSLCSAPNEKGLTVGIKKVPDGVFSTFANEALAVGDRLRVMPPAGRFVLSSSVAHEALLLVAAGSGITPLFSIIKHSLQTAPERPIHLVYGNKNPKETMFKQDLETLEKNAGGSLKIHWVYSQSKEENALFGRIDGATVRPILAQMSGNKKQAFLCGPEEMITAVKSALIEEQLDESSIFYELFQTKKEAEISPATKETVTVTLITDDESYTVTSPRTQTLLDGALNEKIEVPYSCQGGVCCSCIAKITHGEAAMENNQTLTDTEIEEGLVLTCISYPTSSQITVNYDEV